MYIQRLSYIGKAANFMHRLIFVQSFVPFKFVIVHNKIIKGNENGK